MIKEMFDVTQPAASEVIHTEHLTPVVDKTVTKVATDKTGSSSDDGCLGCHTSPEMVYLLNQFGMYGLRPPHPRIICFSDPAVVFCEHVLTRTRWIVSIPTNRFGNDDPLRIGA